MKYFLKRLKALVKYYADQLIKWRWIFLAIIGLSLLWVEIQEFLVLRILNQAFHYVEVVQYAILIVTTGLLVELFARLNRAHRRMSRLLDFKHRLSLDFVANENWDALLEKLAEVPSRIVSDVDEVYILVSNQISRKFDVMSHWVSDDCEFLSEPWDPTVLCEDCLRDDTGNKTSLHLCISNIKDRSSLVYSWKIVGVNIPTTVLKFRLKAGGKLYEYDDYEDFHNVSDEIIVALRASHDRKMLFEMQAAQVAMAERRHVFAYVHDQLGQNLGYMHLKLDQLGSAENYSDLKYVRAEVNQLRNVANESYEIVRDILKKLQPETIPHLTNLLHEHARSISRRASFELDFKVSGKPIQLSPEIQQVIFFVFSEMLHNVEQHAMAGKVKVEVIWHDCVLDISIKDNGVGFDVQSVRKDEHFGLDIMRERVAFLQGLLNITSSIDTGTIVSVSIPFKVTEIKTKETAVTV
jgi:signal transduction histidine kinase